MKTLFVAGTFDDKGGKPSGYASKLYSSLEAGYPAKLYRTLEKPLNITEYQNGGNFEVLQTIINRINTFDVVIWMIDVPNDKEKLVDLIKKMNPTTMLVTSKRNFDNQYNRLELLGRMLQVKTNLLIEFIKKDDKFAATIIDPLANAYCYEETNIEVVAKKLSERLKFIIDINRAGSEQIGEAKQIPDEKEFFALVKKNAEVFHSLVQGVNTERFLGNASFRCIKGGFPSFRHKNLAFVSRRNVDKRSIDKDGFVAVELSSFTNSHNVKYYGEYKPSVDTPVQSFH